MRKRKQTTDIVIIISVLILLTIIGILYYNTIEPKEPTFEDKATQLCKEPNTNSVFICNGQIIEINLDTLGGGTKYVHQDGTTFACPIVGLDSMSVECKAIFNAKQSNQWNCEKIC